MASSIEAIQKILQETVDPGINDLRERLIRVEVEIKRLDDKIDNGLACLDPRSTMDLPVWTNVSHARMREWIIWKITFPPPLRLGNASPPSKQRWLPDRVLSLGQKVIFCPNLLVI